MEPEKPWSVELEQERQAYLERAEYEGWSQEVFPWPPLAEILDYEKFEAGKPKYVHPPLDPWDDYGEGKL